MVATGIIGGRITVPVPERPSGQESVIGLRTAPLDVVRVGVVGLGARGAVAVENLICVPDCKVTAICDVSRQAVEHCEERLRSKGLSDFRIFEGEDAWKALCECPDVDVVCICTDWSLHVQIALHAMENGRHVALEVPAAHDMDDLWALVDAAERTRRHCIMLENCVYDSFEMATRAMAEAGVFGEIVHVEGAYNHFLTTSWSEWRLEFNRKRRGDLYPTHGAGPICQLLALHRKDIMKTLVSMDTASFNGRRVYEDRTGRTGADFKNADQTDTMIRTAKGRTMLIQHNVMNPRPYDRLFKVVGTEGYAAKYPVEQYCLLDKESDQEERLYQGDQVKELQNGYPALSQIHQIDKMDRPVGPRGDMDFIMYYRLVHCLHNGLPLDMDVYDMAEWCCISELSRISLENGNMPVEVPDFTRGDWERLDISRR